MWEPPPTPPPPAENQTEASADKITAKTDPPPLPVPPEYGLLNIV